MEATTFTQEPAGIDLFEIQTYIYRDYILFLVFNDNKRLIKIYIFLIMS